MSSETRRSIAPAIDFTESPYNIPSGGKPPLANPTDAVEGKP